MKKLIPIFAIALFLLIVSPVQSSFEINTFNTSLQTEFVYLPGNENGTRYINVPLAANVTYFSMNITGISAIKNISEVQPAPGAAFNQTMGVTRNQNNIYIAYNYVSAFPNFYGNITVINASDTTQILSSFLVPADYQNYANIGQSGALYYDYTTNETLYMGQGAGNVNGSTRGLGLVNITNSSIESIGSFANIYTKGIARTSSNIYQLARSTSNGRDVIYQQNNSYSTINWLDCNTSSFDYTAIINQTSATSWSGLFDADNRLYVRLGDTDSFVRVDIDNPVCGNSTEGIVLNTKNYDNFTVTGVLAPLGAYFDKPTKTLLVPKNSNAKNQSFFIAGITYPTDPWIEVGTVDGTHEWNFTGSFEQKGNMTTDLSGAINTALDGGACTGGIVIGQNCSIPITFHSDDYGKMESTFNVTYISNMTPIINVLSPDPNITDRDNVNFTINPAFSPGFNCSQLRFNVTRGAETEIIDQSVSNCESIIFDVSSDKTTYLLNIWLNDTSGNTNVTSYQFRVDEPDGGGGFGGSEVGGETGTSGGASGGSPIVIIGGNLNWTVQTDNGASRYDLIMSLGESRSRGIQFVNNGENQVNIDLVCEGDGCQYVEFEDQDVLLASSLVEVVTEVDFQITLPDEGDIESLEFAILATDQEGNEARLPVQIQVGLIGNIINYVDKALSLSGLLALVIATVIFAIFNFFFLKNVDTRLIISLVFSGISFLLILIFI